MLCCKGCDVDSDLALDNAIALAYNNSVIGAVII